MVSEAIKFDGIVRPLKREDLAPLKPILETWVRDSQTGEILQAEVLDDLISLANSLNGTSQREYFVAQTIDGKVIGMIGLSPLKDVLKQFASTQRPIELINAYVDRTYRAGRGIGSALVKQLTHRATAQGFTEILLDSGPRYRETGWGFWDKQPGFSRVGIVHELYDPNGNAPVWQKLLMTP